MCNLIVMAPSVDLGLASGSPPSLGSIQYLRCIGGGAGWLMKKFGTGSGDCLLGHYGNLLI